MKRIAIAAAFAALLLVPSGRAEDSLYKELGGYDGIAAVTDNFLGKLTSDSSLGRFFTGLSVSSGKKVRQLIVDFVCESSGGPCVYTGRPMLEAHTGLKITPLDWTDSLELFAAAMTELKVDPAVQAKVGIFVGALEGDIVGH